MADMGSDVRFVVTNLPGSAKLLYEKVYYARGRATQSKDKDQRIKTNSIRRLWTLKQRAACLSSGNAVERHLNRIASSRRLEGESQRNLETM